MVRYILRAFALFACAVAISYCNSHSTPELVISELNKCIRAGDVAKLPTFYQAIPVIEESQLTKRLESGVAYLTEKHWQLNVYCTQHGRHTTTVCYSQNEKSKDSLVFPVTSNDFEKVGNGWKFAKPKHEYLVPSPVDDISDLISQKEIPKFAENMHDLCVNDSHLVFLLMNELLLHERFHLDK